MARAEQHAAEYRIAKAHPLKRYAEEPTFLTAVGDVAGHSVLDLGCGYGSYARLLKTRGAARVVGVDASRDMIAAARAEEERHPLGIEYVQADVLRLGRIAAFDRVAAAFLFVYASTRDALLHMCRTCAENLAPGGRLVAVTLHPELSLGPERRSANTRIELDAGQSELGDGAALRVQIGDASEAYRVRNYFWRATTYEQCLEQAGFCEIEWIPLTPSPAGRRALGDAFWDDALEKPSSVVLRARRGER